MDNPQERTDKTTQDANQCIAIGAGVGALGLTVGTIVGATCPLCYVVAPSLIGVGLFHRIRSKFRARKLSKDRYLKIRQKSYRPRPADLS